MRRVGLVVLTAAALTVGGISGAASAKTSASVKKASVTKKMTVKKQQRAADCVLVHIQGTLLGSPLDICI
jgi:hypothetical protein